MLKLSVVTPGGQALDQEVDEVTLPGLLGEFGVLPGHVPLIAALKSGVLTWKRGIQRGRLALGSGFAEVDGKDAVVVLVQDALAPEEIDRAAVEQTLAAAPTDDDRAFAEAQLEALKAA